MFVYSSASVGAAVGSKLDLSGIIPCNVRTFRDTSTPEPPDTFLFRDGFGGLVVSMLASGTQVCGFKPDRSGWILRV